MIVMFRFFLLIDDDENRSIMTMNTETLETFNFKWWICLVNLFVNFRTADLRRVKVNALR